MSIVKHRPRHDEALIPCAKPVMRPTGVPAVPLGCEPGTGRTVIAELRAADRTDFAATAWAMVLAPLRQLLDQPVPATNWFGVLGKLDNRVPAELHELGYRATRELDRVANDLYTGQHGLFLPDAEELDAVDADIAAIRTDVVECAAMLDQAVNA